MTLFRWHKLGRLFGRLSMGCAACAGYVLNAILPPLFWALGIAAMLSLAGFVLLARWSVAIGAGFGLFLLIRARRRLPALCRRLRTSITSHAQRRASPRAGAVPGV